MARMFAAAEVLKPQGIKGEVKLKSLGNDPSELLDVSEVYFTEKGEKAVKVNKAWRYKDSVFMALDGVTTRNDAEELREKKLFVRIDEEAELKEGEYYISDLIGCNLIDENGNALGKLKDILQHGSADVYVVKGEKSFMMPALKKVIKRTDIKEKTITVDSQKLMEVAVYED